MYRTIHIFFLTLFVFATALIASNNNSLFPKTVISAIHLRGIPNSLVFDHPGIKQGDQAYNWQMQFSEISQRGGVVPKVILSCHHPQNNRMINVKLPFKEGLVCKAKLFDSINSNTPAFVDIKGDTMFIKTSSDFTQYISDSTIFNVSASRLLGYYNKYGLITINDFTYFTRGYLKDEVEDTLPPYLDIISAEFYIHYDSSNSIVYSRNVQNNRKLEPIDDILNPKISLRVVDITGKTVWYLPQIKSFYDTKSNAWDQKDKDGNPVPSGLYIIELKIGDFTHRQKVILMDGEIIRETLKIKQRERMD